MVFETQIHQAETERSQFLCAAQLHPALLGVKEWGGLPGVERKRQAVLERMSMARATKREEGQAMVPRAV